MGIEIDSVAKSLRLPAEKLERLVSTIQEWGDRKVCTRRQLESLVGLLNHTCKVVWPGHMFLRQMIDLLTATGPTSSSHPHHHIRIIRKFRADLAWWQLFLRPWNGVGLMEENVSHLSIKLASDASGSWGCRAWWGPRWFQYAWEAMSSNLDISVKELFPIVVAAVVWGDL